jgi:hypothetical protein
MSKSKFPLAWIASATGFVGVVLLWFTYYQQPISASKPVSSRLPEGKWGDKWDFSPLRDSRNLGLSDEQCDVSLRAIKVGNTLTTF